MTVSRSVIVAARLYKRGIWSTVISQAYARMMDVLMGRDSLPPLNWLRAFEASARHLSFTGAAQELNMTQSAVSQQIKSLETYLGRALFVRRSRSLQITEAGRTYLPTVQEAFATLGAGTRALVGGDRGKVLTIQCNLAFSVYWLAPRLDDLLARHPWLALNIVTAIWDPERTAPAADIEIRYGRGLEESGGAERLTRDMFYPVCAPATAETADWRTAQLFDCAGMRANWEAWLRDQGERLPKGKTVHLATTYVISLSAVEAGSGLAMAHGTIADRLMASNRLVRPFEHEVTMGEAYYLMTAPAHAATPASRAFRDWLSEACTNS